ncbi:hypothetical protein TEA_026190 [Camellia sinensis var. sinensis]|uniref:Cytochrome P450 n=1 Tax=Camellia sinensis var. sinensis TaxID=542762 RepID=A0A4S4F216_CAMSN|nr:hypothetical protein TEA_026190 [Camellia sinensis var. sinensis]
MLLGLATTVEKGNRTTKKVKPSRALCVQSYGLHRHGSVYKLAFGPKAFVVVSDPIVVRHILRENAFSYDKGVLADILEPIMGKGLIPADLNTWKQRRRGSFADKNQEWKSIKTASLWVLIHFMDCALGSLEKIKEKLIKRKELEKEEERKEEQQVLNLPFDYINFIAPGFHALYLESMVKIFTNCSGRTILKFEELLEREGLNGGKEIELDLEEEFSSLALDIIGLSVFNYDFGSVTKESPIIKV